MNSLGPHGCSSIIVRRQKRRDQMRLLTSNYRDFMATYGVNGIQPIPQLYTVTRTEYTKAWSKFKRSWNDGILFNDNTQVEDSFASDEFIRKVLCDCLLIARGHSRVSL